MEKDKIINGFRELGTAISRLEGEDKEALFYRAAASNPWYTPENIDRALNGIRLFLDDSILTDWLKNYPQPKRAKKVGLIMAGNIPLVGFHDLLCTIAAGHIAIVKLSSQDEVLPTFLFDLLAEIDADFSTSIEVVEKLSDIDAVIATGSDNSARYFRKYFKEYPHIIRKNRTSVAVLSGNENEEELNLLADDIFSYFGMGCRNVSKLFIPKEYEMDKLIPHLQQHEELANHSKFFNNYEYNKAIYLVNRTEHLDNGFALFTESQELVSPLSVVYFERYDSLGDVKITLAQNEEKLQCVVSKETLDRPVLPFGKAQYPEIDDYADNVDTMEFLCKLD